MKKYLLLITALLCFAISLNGTLYYIVTMQYPAWYAAILVLGNSVGINWCFTRLFFWKYRVRVK